MKKTLFLFFISLMSIFIISCNKDDDNISGNHDDHNHDVVAPDTYSFERNDVSTVSYSGQTCRLVQAAILSSNLKDESNSLADLQTMFTDTQSDGCDGKNIRPKTANSSVSASTVIGQFDQMLVDVVNDVFPNAGNTASVGVAGRHYENDGDMRIVNAHGLEIDQAFTKGLIGALCLDQITNNYLTASKLDGGNNQVCLESDCVDNYTDMEHYWDEGFGYLYGYIDDEYDNSTGIAVGKGSLLNKYLKKVNDNNSPGIADEIYNAFKLGRAAIVAGDMDLRNEQAAIIKDKLDDVVIYKAIDYLRSGGTYIDAGQWPEACHALSEGYGFILSLQFTDHFDNSHSNAWMTQLMANDGFWSRTPAELNSMADDIESVMGW